MPIALSDITVVDGVHGDMHDRRDWHAYPPTHHHHLPLTDLGRYCGDVWQFPLEIELQSRDPCLLIMQEVTVNG